MKYGLRCLSFVQKITGRFISLRRSTTVLKMYLKSLRLLMQMKSPSQEILLMTALQRHSLKLQDKMDVLQAFAKWPGIYGEVADS